MCEASFAVGSFAQAPITRFAELLREKDEVVRQRLLDDINDNAFVSALMESVITCRRAAMLYQNADELTISFNGGKDACVVLYLWLAVVASIDRNNELPKVIYFDSAEEFDSIKQFVAWVVSSLSLRIVKIEQKSFRLGMESLVASNVRAVVMGQRSGDPWMADVNPFSPSTDGWPAFMRINPIIKWSYSHVWTFLRHFGLPYCELYDHGYTSIGSVSDTMPNPALRRQDAAYARAYELQDASLERAGRGTQGKPQQACNSSASKPSQVVRNTSSGSAHSPRARTAGIVVIGNEILSGKVHDANAHYLCSELHCRGVAVKRIEVVGDEVEDIAAAVRSMAESCNFVFTSGGLGPTHDDKTMEGVAMAFRCRLALDERFHGMLSDRASTRKPALCNGDTLDTANGWQRQSSAEAAVNKMSCVPESSKVEWPSDGNPWPLVSMGNVYIFTGMPCIFQAMFKRAAADGRFDGSRLWTSCVLDLDAEEEDIIDALQRTVESHPKVDIGSYPSTTIMHPRTAEDGEFADTTDEGSSKSDQLGHHWQCRLTIVFEAFEKDRVFAARDHLADALPSHMLAA